MVSWSLQPAGDSLSLSAYPSSAHVHVCSLSKINNLKKKSDLLYLFHAFYQRSRWRVYNETRTPSQNGFKYNLDPLPSRSTWKQKIQTAPNPKTHPLATISLQDWSHYPFILYNVAMESRFLWPALWSLLGGGNSISNSFSHLHLNVENSSICPLKFTLHHYQIPRLNISDCFPHFLALMKS